MNDYNSLINGYEASFGPNNEAGPKTSSALVNPVAGVRDNNSSKTLVP